jgi:hypothetical protein
MDAPASDLSLMSQPMTPVSLEQLADLFRAELAHVFESVDVQVLTKCPDLSSAPFDLATKGLGSGVCMALNIGGTTNLVPTPRLDKPDYSIASLCNQLPSTISKDNDQLLVIGAAAGPYRKVGVCCELIPNLSLIRTTESDSNERWTIDRNRTHFARLVDRSIDGSQDAHVDLIQSDRFTLLGNLFVSNGQQGPVIRIKVRKRLLDTDSHVNGSYNRCIPMTNQTFNRFL